MIADIPMGLVRGMGRAYYDITATPANLNAPVSKSLLWDFIKSPYKWSQGMKREETDAMRFGSLVHALALSPDEAARYAVAEFSDFRSKAAQEWRDEQIAAGKTVIKKDDWQRASEIAGEVMESQYIYGLGACDYEVAAFAQIAGQPIKGMFDILPSRGDCIADIKTTVGIGGVRELQRKIVDGGLHLQAALYLDLYEACTGETRDRFDFIFVETSAPYEMAVATLSANGKFIEKGRIAYMNALARYVECANKKTFPPAIQGPIEIEAPEWL